MKDSNVLNNAILEKDIFLLIKSVVNKGMVDFWFFFF